LKIVFWLYLVALLANRREIRKGDEESHANTGHVTKTAIFPNSKWRKAAILKTVFVKFGRFAAEIWSYNDFQNGSRPPSSIFEI